jgi:hypothetical protein
MIDKARRLCWISGILQAVGIAVYLLIPFVVRSSENYTDETTRGWNVLVGFLTKTDELKKMEELTGISLTLLFLCGLIVVLTGLAGFVLSWIKSVPPILPSITATVGFVAAVASWLYGYSAFKDNSDGYQLGLSGITAAGCMLAAGIFGYVAVGVYTSLNKKTAGATMPGLEKLPDVSQKIEEKRYYQVVEKEQPDLPPEVPPFQPGSEPRGVMVGITGVYAGTEIPFQSGETLKIGRDAACNLIYDKSAPRISRHHCEITWNPGSQNYSIVDTSSNGTFKNGSEDCLPQNMRITLEIGCTIALGDEDNVFRLE